MVIKKISQTGLTVSAIGLGCMGMSEFYGTADEPECIATLEEAVELGITHFDTADMYGFGDNERLIGRVLKPFRDKIIIATKFGIVRDKNQTIARGVNGSPEYVKAACASSLERLGMDYIDLYYLHRMDPRVPIEETIQAMAELVKEGKVRYIGLSEADAETIRLAHQIHPISAIQSEYSLWARGPEKEILPLCQELGIGFVAYSPLGRGFLTGKITDVNALEKDDFRRTLPRFQEGNLHHNLLIVDTLEKIAKPKNKSIAQLSLAWVLAQAPFITAIPGTKHRKYLTENMGALTIDLTPEELDTLNKLIPPGFAHGERYAKEVMRAFNLMSD